MLPVDSQNLIERIERAISEVKTPRTKAIAAIEALQQYIEARMGEARVETAQKLLYMTLRELYVAPATSEIEYSIKEIQIIHARLGCVREEFKRKQNAES